MEIRLVRSLAFSLYTDETKLRTETWMLFFDGLITLEIYPTKEAERNTRLG